MLNDISNAEWYIEWVRPRKLATNKCMFLKTSSNLKLARKLGMNIHEIKTNQNCTGLKG